MLVTCDECQRSLEFSGERPSFCAYCGKGLVTTPLARTDSYQPKPASNPQNDTEAPPNNRIITFAGGGQRMPEAIGGYKVLRQLGAGGMGTVYEGEDAVNGRKVAIKLIKPQIAASPDNLDRFRQEGRLASLITHPRCVFVYHADEEKGRPYIVMEMMPGATLKDIVTQQGPLQIGQAINKILDVIDGLQAAHQLGVLHRDVKPSNCFVLTDGHVKVGDFGLSKVLPTSNALSGKSPESQVTTAENVEGITRTGVFIGTPLFASPEQIKGEMVDFRTDVYSVTATLYFLLTGQAPFEGGDNTATIARIVSEDPQSMLQYRSDIPIELDRVILRGLSRDRTVRYGSLAELRQALLQFLPGYLQNAPRSARVRAALVDMALLSPGLILLHQLIPHFIDPAVWGGELVDLAVDLSMWLLILVYFLATEVVAGASFGKWLLRLRVGSMRPGRPPKRRQLLLRALGFFTVVALPGLLALALTGSDWFKWLFHGIGLMLLFDSMRARGGFRGLHEILSKTCVVQVPAVSQPVEFPLIPPTAPAPLPPGIPARIGNYAINGIHRVLDDRIFLVGTDLILDRQVWLVMRPREEGKIAPARREISRSTRLRWLGGGDVALTKGSNKLTHHWDAFIAPATGCSLAHLVQMHGKLSWATTRYLLLQLADELAIALTDDTFPDGLSLEQVWLQPDGQVLIVGARFHESYPGPLENEGPDSIRSVQFLRQAAFLMLEGKLTNPLPSRPIRAPLPVHDRSCLNKLTCVRDDTYASPREVAHDLRNHEHRPAQVTSTIRLGEMLLYGILLFPIILAILLLGRYYLEIKPTLQLTHQVRRAERTMTWLQDPANAATLRQFLHEKPASSQLALRLALMESISSSGVRLISERQRDQFLMASLQGSLKKQRARDLEQLQMLSSRLSLAAILPQLAAVELMSASKNTSGSKSAIPNNNTREDLKLALQHALSPRPLEEEVLPLVQRLTPIQLATISVGSWLIIWVLWAMATNGGISLKLVGVDLQTARGQPAGPFRCGWRAFLVWSPFFALILASLWIQDASKTQLSGPLWVYWIPWWLALIYLAACGVYTLLFPQRGLHDRLAGVYLMPK